MGRIMILSLYECLGCYGACCWNGRVKSKPAFCTNPDTKLDYRLQTVEDFSQLGRARTNFTD